MKGYLSINLNYSTWQRKNKRSLKDSKHTLVAHSHLEASRYLPLLEKNLGKGKFDFILNADNNFEEELYDDDEDMRLRFAN